MRKKILITGVSGLLGNNLAAYFSRSNSVTGLYHSHPVAIPNVETLGCDLCDYSETRKLVCTIHPQVVIHCASRTDVDRMEEDREGAWQANVLTTRVLLDSSRDLELKIIYISTDSVYPGERGPYSEEMEPSPCNWYGETKLEGEKLVSGRDKGLILRTNLYGWNIQDKQSLAEWFLTRLQKGEKTMGFSDAQFSSIYTVALAEIMARCIEGELEGTYNCACRDAWSKFQFGQEIARLFGLDPNLIIPNTLDKADLKARRGKDLSLNVSRLERDLGDSLPTMQDSLGLFFADWLKQVPRAIKQGNSGKPQNQYP